MLMKSHAYSTGRLASAFAAFMIVCVSLLNIAPAYAQQAANLVIAKTLGAGVAGEPADTQARFRAVQLIDLKADETTDLGKLALENPRLLGDDPGYRTGEAHFADTDESGKASFYDLQPGVYQVSEVNLRTGNAHRDVATPILVYINERTALVRAKNQPTVIEKKSGTDTAKPGDELIFHIITSIPQSDADGKMHQYVVIDALDNRLSFKGIDNVHVANTVGTLSLVANDDYVVGESGNRVTFSLKQSGLTKLAGARKGNPETKVHFDIETFVKENADTASPVYNSALFSPDGYCVPKTDESELPSGSPSVLDCSVGLAPEKSNTVSVTLDGTKRPNGSSESQLWWPIAALVAALGLGAAGSSEGSSEKPASKGDTTGAPSERPSNPQKDVPTEAPPTTSQNLGPLSRALESLASTGASVIGIVLAGLTLIALAWVLLSRRRDKDDDVIDGPERGAGERP